MHSLGNSSLLHFAIVWGRQSLCLLNKRVNCKQELSFISLPGYLLHMHSLTDRFCANELSLNVLKTNFVVFKPIRIKQIDIDTLKLGDQTIHRVRSTKFLGIHIDDELEWGDHIEHIANKAASGSYAIRSDKRFLSVDNLKSLYFSLVHSHLAYGNMIWEQPIYIAFIG